MIRICLVGDYDPAVTAHQTIPKALALASEGREVRPEWLHTQSAETEALDRYQAFWCVPASPYRSMEGALRVIQYARENGVPFLGTCGGCQHAVLEFARNVADLPDAGHQESDPQASQPVISKLLCSLIEESETLKTVEGTRLRSIYGAERIVETYRCSYGLNPAYMERLAQHGLRVGIVGPNNEPRAVEISDHPFFFGTLFQPERSALRGEKHPLIAAFVKAAQTQKNQTVNNSGFVAGSRQRLFPDEGV